MIDLGFDAVIGVGGCQGRMGEQPIGTTQCLPLSAWSRGRCYGLGLLVLES
jgi:hypothetical protein